MSRGESGSGCLHGVTPKSSCKTCKADRDRLRRSKNPEKYRAQNRAWREKNLEKHRTDCRESKRLWRQANPDKVREAHRTARGAKEIYRGQLDRLKQLTRCEMCESPPSVKLALAEDHDHKTGLVRGMLCHRCNVALARIDADPFWPEKARAYLFRHESEKLQRGIK